VTSAHRPDDGRESANVEARVMLAAAEVLTAERERVLRGTHHDVLDELLAASIAITALTHDVEPALRLQLDDALHALERAVALLRASMFEQPTMELTRVRPTALLADSLQASAKPIGFTPTLRVDPEVDDIDDPRLLGHLVLSVRELVVNVAQHAAATSAHVALLVVDSTLVLEVADDGVGVPSDHVAGRGFTSLSERAQQLGGDFEVVVPSPGSSGRGTVARWRVPLRRGSP
jgi:signal transduction histidine kinase